MSFYGNADGTTPGQAAAAPPPPIVATAQAVASGGQQVATFAAPTTVGWLVRRIVVQSDTPGNALVYVGGVKPDNLVAGTHAGDLDSDDSGPGYLVGPGQSLAVVWPSGGSCRARIEYTEV